jgi:hypothetical protein
MLLELRCPGLFVRDPIIQLTSHGYPKKLCVTLPPIISWDGRADSPSPRLAPFEKANLVAKLRGARDRKKSQTGKWGGRYSICSRVRSSAFARRTGTVRLIVAGVSPSIREIPCVCGDFGPR